MTTAVLYLRQSLDKTGEELGIERQLGECQRLCEQRGYEVVETIQDNNVSASRGERPGYKRLLDLIEHREADVVVVLRIDRLLRKLTDLEQLVELSERTGVAIATVQGDIDLSNSNGRLVARLLASVARAEVETKGERQRLAYEQAARAGKPHVSRRPFGYEPGLTGIRESEAAVLREMAQRIINGHSYKEVAYWLNREGHTTTTGKLWYALTVRNMLRKKLYAGIRDYKGAAYQGNWPAIFDSETWDKLQLAIRLRSEKAIGATQGRKYLLTGMLYCGKCGNRLTGCRRTESNKTKRGIVYYDARFYSCRSQGSTQRHGGCGGVRRNADALDDWVVQQLFQQLEASLLIGNDAGGLDQTLRDLLDDRKAQQLRIDHLIDDYATGLLTKAQLTRAKATAEAELRTIEEDINRLNRDRLALDLPQGQTVQQAWENSDSDEWKRSLLALFIKSIDVQAGITKPFHTMSDGTRCRFDPSLIEITWSA